MVQPSKNLSGKRILAIDYGKKITGLALFKVNSDPYPLTYGRLEYQNDEKLIIDVKTIIAEEFVDIVVLGIPYFTDGTASNKTLELQNFGKKLKAEIAPIELFEQDETLSTFEAEERMKNSPEYNFKVDLKKIDALSATIILEDFLKTYHNS